MNFTDSNPSNNAKTKIAGLLMLTLVASSASASVPAEVARFNGQKGVLFMDDKSTGASCNISLRRLATGETYLTLSSNVEFGTATVPVDTLKSSGNGTYQTSSNGSRLGGDQCGDFGGMRGFEEYLVVNQDSIAVIQSYRCLFEGLRKYTFVLECTGLR